MDASTRAPGYDLFKLIVAILLLLLFLCLLFWIPANAPEPEATTANQVLLPETPSITETIPPLLPSPTGTSLSDSSTSTPLPLPSPGFTATNDTLTSPVLTSTSSLVSPPTGTATAIELTATPALIPSPTSTQTTIPPTIVPSPTEPPVLEATATTIVEAPSTIDVCEAAMSRARLSVGGNATILRRLNFRTSPGIQNNWIRTNIPGTQVEVIDGPVCLPHLIGAYVWWQIRLPDGQIGWSAESSLFGRFYFMEPNP